MTAHDKAVEYLNAQVRIHCPQTKVEDLTNEQLDVLVAEKVKGWQLLPKWPDGSVTAMTAGVEIVIIPSLARDDAWSPSTDIAAAFQVDRPVWRWEFEELVLYDNNADGHPTLEITLYGYLHQLADIFIPLDPDNKTAAYCRGRCIAACYACGITEV